MLVSSIGLLATTLTSHALVWGNVVEIEHAETVTKDFYLRKIAPIGATMALTLAFGNAVYAKLFLVQL